MYLPAERVLLRLTRYFLPAHFAGQYRRLSLWLLAQELAWQKTFWDVARVEWYRGNLVALERRQPKEYVPAEPARNAGLSRAPLLPMQSLVELASQAHAHTNICVELRDPTGSTSGSPEEWGNLVLQDNHPRVQD
jgi:hypothetical protein